MTAGSITQFAVHVGLVVLGISFLLTVWRVIKGPTLPDRVIALDMLVGIVMGFIALIAIRTGFTLYIDIAISLGLVGFLATVAFARFILSRKRREGEDGAPPATATGEAAQTVTGSRLPVALTGDIAAPANMVSGAAAEPAPASSRPVPSRGPATKSEAAKASAAKVKIAKAKAAGKAAAAADPAKARSAKTTAAKTTAAKTGAEKTAMPKTPRRSTVKKETP